MANSASFPPALNVWFYPTSPSGPFPEQAGPHSRYAPANAPLGVCFSGGGPRSFAASLGQMRGLAALGLLDQVGAISCVSGGTWFGVLFTYAPSSIADSDLLGPVVAPGSITLGSLEIIADDCIASSLLNLTNEAISAYFATYLWEYTWGDLPFDRIYSRILNALMLRPFRLDSRNTFFSLDAAAVAAIVAQNPGLTASNVYTMRPGRPYFIAGATQIYPTGDLFTGESALTTPRLAVKGAGPWPQPQPLVRPAPRTRPFRLAATAPPARSSAARSGAGMVLRHFEYSALYSGTAQWFPGIGPAGQDFGGGYVANLGFDTDTPTPGGAGTAQVATPQPFFLLSDVMGSSGAAPGGYLDEIGLTQVFPEFSFWPPVQVGSEAACTYSMVDGGILENVGIVPLLRRGFSRIIAFVNGSSPIGSTDPGCYNGIDGQITRLFGFIPVETLGNDQSTQIFPSSQLDALAGGLKAAKAAGQPIVFCGQFTIEPNNPFGLVPGPDGGTVRILWVYNDLNAQWVAQLAPAVAAVLSATDPADYMANFPTYNTVFQNEGELLYFTPRQINLLAHMSCSTTMSVLGNPHAPIRAGLA
jgi:hypothetical protein